MYIISYTMAGILKYDVPTPSFIPGIHTCVGKVACNPVKYDRTLWNAPDVRSITDVFKWAPCSLWHSVTVIGMGYGIHVLHWPAPSPPIHAYSHITWKQRDMWFYFVIVEGSIVVLHVFRCIDCSHQNGITRIVFALETGNLLWMDNQSQSYYQAPYRMYYHST